MFTLFSPMVGFAQRGFQKLALVLLTALFCSNWPGANAGSGPVVKIAFNPWTGSRIDAELARIVLKERLGYTVELVAIDEQVQFPALSRNELSVTMEVWPSGHAENRRQYIETAKSVEDLGPLGITGKIGWYIPSYLIVREPSLVTWEGIKTHSDLFRTAATGSQGQFLQGDPSWIYRDQQIITNLGLNLKVVQTGSEAALAAAVDSAYAKQEPVLFYFWTPHAFHSSHLLTEVKLPPFSEGCGGCDYPTEIPFKAASSQLRVTAPSAYRFFRNLRISNSDQIEMLGSVETRGESVEVAVRKWMQTHESLVASWIAGTNGLATAIPAAANPWAAQYLSVLDKDTNGVFLNANELFVQSVKPLFPAIQNVTNLVGLDDYYFYSSDLAAKFRADDQRVMASGLSFSTVEINEPSGGGRAVVRVTKVPLRDEFDRIVGIRAIWHSHPQLEARPKSGGIEISFPRDAGMFRLERRNAFNPPEEWVAQDFTTVFLGTNLSVVIPMTNRQAFFRLNAERPITIGALLSLSGEWSTLGKSSQALLHASVDDVNLQARSSGSPFVFNVEVRDTKLEPAKALEEIESLYKKGVRVVIGPQSSSELRAVKPFADANGILLISQGSTASSLSLPGDNAFRFCPDDTYEGAAMATLLKADGISTVVTMFRDDAGNLGLRESTSRSFEGLGGKSVNAGKYSPDETNWVAVVTSLANAVAAEQQNGGTVAVYLPAFDEITNVFRIARSNSSLSSIRWYGGDGNVQSESLVKDFISAEFAAGRGFPCPTFGLDSRFAHIWQPLANLVKTRIGQDPDAFALAAYDALQVAVAAYVQVGNTPAFADLKAAFLLAAGKYVGATGPTLLNAAGDRAGGSFDFWSIRSGTNGYLWKLTHSYQPQGNGGTIVRIP